MGTIHGADTFSNLTKQVYSDKKSKKDKKSSYKKLKKRLKSK